MNGHGGARPGAGRKTKAAEDDIKELLSAAWPRASRIKTLKKFAQQAEEGCVKSVRVLLEYGYGKPKETLEMSGPDGAAITITSIVAVKPENARSDGDND